MALLDVNTAQQIRKIFEQMKDNVKVVLVTGKSNCESCDDTIAFAKEMTALSGKLSLELVEDGQDRARELNVVMVPALVLLDKDGKDHGIKFYGIPAGHEINSFLTGILEVSGVGQELPSAMTTQIMNIDKPVDIKVFVTLGCPHCPGAVAKAHKLALMNKNIRAQMIEANTFGEMSAKYNVSGVPKIVFNDTEELLGDQPLEAFLSMMKSL